ncbi:hypothetical protein VTN00DRAFT_3672 [Thermoascus crustaceus]|uniref:uncharacterized protein n=1 Tax=Thermoascus crustaceus TaxID=5088 RepID=UPI0037438863
MSAESSFGGDQSPPKGRTEILELLVPFFSGTKDDYGKEDVPPLPLTFDRVNEGRPPSSNALLFKLPVEILANILLHIPQDSLASLAFVNRDCRQLARSRQFSSIRLDYSDTGLQLIVHLMQESADRLSNHGHTSLPSLGACIRRLTVATSPAWVEFRHGLALEELKTLPEEEKTSRIDKASAVFFDKYIPAIEKILPSLPHLELLDWEDMIELGRGFFQSLVKSHFHHLKLFRIQVAEGFQVSIPKELTAHGWPLRTLYLELNGSFRNFKKDRPSVLPLAISLLRACARTLESLTWISSMLDGQKPARANWDLTLPPFEKLRDLTLRRQISAISLSILHALIPPSEQCRLRSLSIEPGPVISEFLNQRGKIQSLERLEWSDFGEMSSMDFVLANDEVRRLCIPYPAPSELLGSKLLPVLSRSFVNLTSLRLTWKEKLIPEEALRLISTIKGLEQICLSAGEQIGWRHDWLIDHQAMRETFSKLPNLRKFAFPRDSYDGGMEGQPVEEYYSNAYTIEALDAVQSSDWVAEDQGDTDEGHAVDFPSRIRKAWERNHRAKMLSEADKYLQAMPDHPLEWMYFGQIPMGVRVIEGKKEAYPLFHERDDCYTLLRKMFTWDTYNVA